MWKGRTSFVIAHRLSTIQDADLIVIINGGNVEKLRSSQVQHPEWAKRSRQARYKRTLVQPLRRSIRLAWSGRKSESV